MCRLHQGEEGAGVSVTGGRELLPANVVPTHYNLTLEPDLEKFTYLGQVVIDLDVVENTTSVSLNTLELEIHTTKITAGSQTIRLVASFLEDVHISSNTPQLVS